MRRQVFNFLKDYSTTPESVDRLIMSSYIVRNNLTVENNILLKQYLINDDSEDFEALTKFLSVADKEIGNFDIEVLIELFEFVISPADRIVTGAIYTPKHIRDFIVSNILDRQVNLLQNIKIADISCGCGGFLFTVALNLRRLTGFTYQQIFENNLFGLDIQEYSITRTKLLLSILALNSGEDQENYNFNLFIDDALSFNWAAVIENFIGFHAIVGNPPYVRLKMLSKETKNLLQRWEVAQSGLTDLYIPFFQIGYENLAENGLLGYITMNSFFKSLNGRKLRSYFQRNRVGLQIIDFGAEQIFKSKNTYTCICFLENLESEYVEFCSILSQDLPKNAPINFDRIPYQGLNAKKGWNLKDHATIELIESIGKPFGEIYTTRHGIATLKNEIYIFKPIMEDENFYYLQNGQVFPIEKGICRQIVNSNRLSRESLLEEIKETVIFPYTNDRKPKLLEEKFFRETYPNAFNYLQNKKSILGDRDKGEGKYENWYAYGRTQSLEKITTKLFFPKLSDQNPSCILESDENLLFYNGLAVVSNDDANLLIIKKILESDIFWYYIKTTSKPYSSKYYSLKWQLYK